MKKRDETIDLLRGLAMLWVIVVHVLYWGNFFRNGYINLLKSFCLFEMPLFFFVTGAGNSFSKIDGYLSFVRKRYTRVLIPYWVFACICAALSIAYWGMSDGIELIMAIKILLSWLIPIDRQITTIPYLTWALWFVPVYLCVILILPVLKRMKSSKNAIPFLFVLAALFALACFANMGWIQNVVFYSLWTYIGLFYKDIILCMNERCYRKCLGLTALIGTVVMLILYAMGNPIDMQNNKFPPNIMFGVFSVVMMSLVLLIIPYINKAYGYMGKSKVAKTIFDLFSTRSMTIFLYQVFAFNLTIWLANVLVSGSGIMAAIVKSIVCFIATVPVCAVLAFIFGRVENIGAGWQREKYEEHNRIANKNI